jgi:hypothetical protein
MVKPTYVYQECSQTSNELDTALSKAQGEFKKVLRNRQGPYGMFADLSAMEDATKPALAKYGLSVRQTFVTQEDRSMLLVTRLSCKGEFCVSAIPIPYFPNPQHTHSFCTYMARLGYSRILCLSVDDASDGEDIPEGGGEDSAPAPTPSRPGPDLNAIKAAVKTAATAERLDALWARVEEHDLPAGQLAEIEKAFVAQRARLTKPKKEQPGDGAK